LLAFPQASCISDVFVIMVSLSASNVKGNTKRAMVNTFYFIGYAVGAFAAPQLWKSDTAPRFFEGVVTAIVAWFLLMLVMAIYWWICAAENKRRDALPAQEWNESEKRDVTDKDDLTFRYSY
jgi:prolipoprotein diacylglyceryltransferase